MQVAFAAMTKSNCSSTAVVHILFARTNWKLRFTVHRSKNPNAGSRHVRPAVRRAAPSGYVFRQRTGNKFSTGLVQVPEDFFLPGHGYGPGVCSNNIELFY